jgi:hypothetical protein
MAFEKIGGNNGGNTPAWVPNPGDKIIGPIRRREVVMTEYGETPLLEVEDKTLGPVTVWCGKKVLKGVYDNVAVGNTLDLTFKGDKVSVKSGRTYQDFSASVDRG